MIAAADLRVHAGGRPLPRLRLRVQSSPEGRWARIEAPASAEVEASETVTVALGDDLVVQGAAVAVHRGDSAVRLHVESAASRSLRRSDDLVGPLGQRETSAAVLAGAALDGLPCDLSALPRVTLRWSAPRAPRRWVLRSLLDAAALAAADAPPLRTVVRADGELAVGDERVLRRTGAQLAGLLRGPAPAGLGDWAAVETAAVPLGYGDVVQWEASEWMVVRSELSVSAGRYRSRIWLEALS